MRRLTATFLKFLAHKHYEAFSRNLFTPTVSTLALIAAAFSFKVANQSSFDNNRAWVEITPRIFMVNGQYSVGIEYTNIGKSPAKLISLTTMPRQWFGDIKDTMGLDAQFIHQAKNNACNSKDAPNIVIEKHSMIWPNNTQRPVIDGFILKEPEQTNLQSKLGQITFVIQGCANYLTENRIKHVAYCYFPLTQRTIDGAHWLWSECTTGNEAD